ncbi:hypothetical protein Cfor_06937 [Coptotermes formosanus]|uniref:Centriolar coiled-coil protein of 110 kDa n=1 Tax=Coptotermes formosanus TaxID=36987 RepID=A0A6L2P9J1_COPFO|nr:hypothetical protein Cfor_06937 [Coptotermes formosanus]
MSETSSDWTKSPYVSCMKINGKPILPPLLTPERRAEMCHYKQLAVAVEARLQGRTRKNSSNESISEDSSVTILSGTEHASSNHHFCTNTTVDSKCTCEMEPTLSESGISFLISALNNVAMEKLMPSNESEEIIHRTADLRSKLANVLGSFQQHTMHHNPVLVMNAIQQRVMKHNCSSEMENDGQCVTIHARTEKGLCSGNKDSSVHDSRSEGVLVNDDIKDCDKCGLENMEHNSALILTENIFSSNYTGFRPWNKVHNSGTSNECDTVLKPCQGNVSSMSGNQETKQVVTESPVNVNFVESAEHRLVKNGNHHSLIIPDMQNVKQQSASFVTDTDDNGQKCGSGNNALGLITECINHKECMSQDKNHSKNPLELVKLQPEVKSAFLLCSQKAAIPSVPVQNIPHLGKVTHAVDNVSKPGKICEGNLDTSKCLQSESCGSDNYVKLNSLESDRNITLNKYVSSEHNSPGHAEFSDVTSDMPHQLTQENLEDSVSSAAMTSSTDLNHYMNITESSDSGSPGQDVGAYSSKLSGQDVGTYSSKLSGRDVGTYSSKLSGQDVHHSTSNMTAWQSSSVSENSVCGRNLQPASCSESKLISCQEAQESVQNNVINTRGTSSRQDNVYVVEKFVVLDDSSDDLKVSYPVNTDCAICPTKNFHTACENMNCHVAKPAECLTVPKLKLQPSKSVHGHDDLETSASQDNRCVQDPINVEKSLNKLSGWDIPKPVIPPPRLMRQNSYTLDAPSPLLVAHVEMQKEKNSIYDMTGSSGISPKPCRKAWNLEKAKSGWKPDGRTGNSLFAALDQEDKPIKKINCGVTNSSRCASSADYQDRHVSSLPASHASSPAKVLTPFASLDSLPSAVTIESVKTFPQESTPRQNKGSFVDRISSAATRVTNRSKTSQKKSPASNTLGSTKLRTPSALLDRLPSVSSTNTTKTSPQPSAYMKNIYSSKCRILSTPTKQSSNKSRTSQNKSPAKIFRKDLPTANPSVASQDNLKKMSDLQYVPLPSQQDMQRLILHMQSEHHQQMADLLAKQRLEQEKLREAFLRQQEELVLEIRKVYSAAFCASESQNLLAQQTPSRDCLASHEKGSLNSSINPFPSGLSSKSLSCESAGTSDTSTHDTPGNCILLDTDLERFHASASASTVNEQTVTGNGLYRDSMLYKAPGLSDMTAYLHESNDKPVSVEEVPQNHLQNCNSLILSDSNSIERYLPVASTHPTPEVLVAPQFGKLQKHSSDAGEENMKAGVDTCNVNSAVSHLSSIYPGITSSAPASRTVSLSGTANHVLQGAEVDFTPSSVPSASTVHESGCVEVNDRPSDSIRGRSPCVRQLFPPREDPGGLHRTPALSHSELEQIAATRITAAARGFLTRRLLRTARVQDLIVTIRDTVLCALKVHQDSWSNITPEDVALHGRLIQQVTAACHNLYGVFFSLSTSEKMAIIAADRDRLRNQTPRPLLPRPLSAATRRAIERKMLQSIGGHLPRNRPASAGCILHRKKSTGSDNQTHSGKLTFCIGVNSMTLVLNRLHLHPNLVSKLVSWHFKLKHICTHTAVLCKA